MSLMKDKEVSSLKSESENLTQETEKNDGCCFSGNLSSSDNECNEKTMKSRPLTPIVLPQTQPSCILPVVSNDEEQQRVDNAVLTNHEKKLLNRTHWSMRVKYLEVTLKINGMDRIVKRRI